MILISHTFESDLPMETIQQFDIQEGCVHFQSFTSKHEIKRDLTIKMDTTEILSLLKQVQSMDTIDGFPTWQLDDKIGPMNGKVLVNGKNLTDVLRNQIPIPNLFGFDCTDLNSGVCYCME